MVLHKTHISYLIYFNNLLRRHKVVRKILFEYIYLFLFFERLAIPQRDGHNFRFPFYPYTSVGLRVEPKPHKSIDSNLGGGSVNSTNKNQIYSQ